MGSYSERNNVQWLGVQNVKQLFLFSKREKRMMNLHCWKRVKPGVLVSYNKADLEVLFVSKCGHNWQQVVYNKHRMA